MSEDIYLKALINALLIRLGGKATFGRSEIEQAAEYSLQSIRENDPERMTFRAIEPEWLRRKREQERQSFMRGTPLDARLRMAEELAHVQSYDKEVREKQLDAILEQFPQGEDF